ncbi:MAG: hypothetical protein H7Y86_02960 [Rhizobacter sp.]|nr:hypothetical protein [Ferruginibacter sp.]
MKLRSIFLLMGIIVSNMAIAQEPLYPFTFFTNSSMAGDHFFSAVQVNTPSKIYSIRGRLPVNSAYAHTAGNSLQLEYNSDPSGNWTADIFKPEIRGQDFFITAKYLSLWIMNNSVELSGHNFPVCRLIKKDSSYSNPVKITRTKWSKWKQVIIPIEKFNVNAADIIGISFSQNPGSIGKQSLYIDDIEFLGDLNEAAFPKPVISKLKGYSKHIDIEWPVITDSNIRYVKIYRYFDKIRLSAVRIQDAWSNRYSDYTEGTGREYTYRIAYVDKMFNESKKSEPVSAATQQLDDDAFLDMIQEASFRYYWDGAEKVSGLAKENIPGRRNMVASGASGFGIMALLVGTERKFITRQESIDRFLKITSFLERTEKFHGAFSHFIDGPSAKVETFFGKRDNGGDLVETSFLIQGLLAAKAYFNKEDENEKKIREAITRIWHDVEWDWYRRYPDNKYLLWHWSPDQEWVIDHKLVGWNETMVTYLLAIASPTHAVPATMYYSGWASQDVFAQEYRKGWGQTSNGSMYTNGNKYFGIKLDIGVSNGGPLFFTHYSYLGYDPKQVNDKYTNYFTNNQNIANINLRYCIKNPGGYKGYSDSAWGLTASDGPFNYSADEPVPQQDRGKIAPTGAISSFPYTPGASMRALKNYYNNYGHFLWGEYGFKDAFNLSQNWCSALYMGLNQAPMVVMIENYRTELIWKLFMSNPEIKEGLKKIQDLNTP